MKKALIGMLLLRALYAADGTSTDDCGLRLQELTNSYEVAIRRSLEAYGGTARSIDVKKAVYTNKGYTGRLVAEVTLPDGKVRSPGFIDYTVNGDRLSINVDVMTHEWGAGINRLLLLAVLKRHPEIRHLDSHLGDTNGAAFLVNLTLSPPEGKHRPLTEKVKSDKLFANEVFDWSIAEIKNLKSGKSAAKFRQRMLDSYADHTPSGRTAATAGLKKIRTLVFSPLNSEDCSLYANTEVAPARDDGEARVMIDLGAQTRNRYVEILPSGEVRRTPTRPTDFPIVP